MTLENLLSHVGTGTKHLTDRYSEYAGPIHDHDHHVIYTYETSGPSHGHVAKSKHYGGGYHKSGSMSALTLLAFLFFFTFYSNALRII